jgi:hypothetical protein
VHAVAAGRVVIESGRAVAVRSRGRAFGGEYRVEVSTSDTRGNRTVSALAFTVANEL